MNPTIHSVFTDFNRMFAAVSDAAAELKQDNDAAEQRAMLRAAQAEQPRLQALRDPLPNRTCTR